MKKTTVKKAVPKAPKEPRELTEPRKLTHDDFAHAIRRDQRQRIVAGTLQPGDVAALRRFVRLTQEQFAKALGISVRTLQNCEQDRVTPEGPGRALLRTAGRDPSLIRKNLASVA